MAPAFEELFLLCVSDPSPHQNVGRGVNLHACAGPAVLLGTGMLSFGEVTAPWQMPGMRLSLGCSIYWKGSQEVFKLEGNCPPARPWRLKWEG